MKNKLVILITTLSCIFTLVACGEDPELKQFKKNMDDFCSKISDIDKEINSINPESENAVDDLLAQLNDLDIVFQAFAKLDFPEEFDYLEDIADESSEYMTEAVENYRLAYSNGSYNEYTAEYAQENYSRAYKRVQIILTFLHGETPDDVLLSDDENE